MEIEPPKQSGPEDGRVAGAQGKSEAERRAEAEQKQTERPVHSDDGDKLG